MQTEFELEMCVVEILEDETTLGTGFVVSREGLVATCYHVIKETTSVKIYFHQANKEMKASVLPKYQLPEDDVAFLLVDGPLPPEVQVAPLGDSKKIEGFEFWSKGYRKVSRYEGLLASGIILGLVQKPRQRYKSLQLDPKYPQYIEIYMSGAPIFVPKLGRVVGMIKSFIENRPERFGIPAEALVATCPSLCLQPSEPQIEEPILTFEEYTRRSQISPLLKYRFVGRKGDLEKLHNFLEKIDKKIEFVIGDGGTGKTRLALEFAQQVIKEGNWNVYFIHPDKDFPPLSIRGKTLLILDEVTRYKNERSKDWEKLINHVENPPSKDTDIRLLLLDRPIFEESIEFHLKEIKSAFSKYIIKKGEIVEFLKENKELFGVIDDDTARDIDKECKNSFDLAISYAEYYKEKRIVGTAKEILDWKTSKYIKDIAINTGHEKAAVDIDFYIGLISLITPIKSEDIEYIISKFRNSEILKNILGVPHIKSELLFFYNNECVIKPSLLADYLRLEFMKKKDFETIWKPLLPNMAFRIAYNIAILRKHEGIPAETDRIDSTLKQIWDILNKNKGPTVDYFKALLLFTGSLANLPFFDRKSNIDLWVKSYHEIHKTSPEVTEEFAKVLVNALSYFGNALEFENMENCLNKLNNLYEKYPDREVKEKLCLGLDKATSAYESAVKKRLEDLKKLHEDRCEKCKEDALNSLPGKVKEIIDEPIDEYMFCWDKIPGSDEGKLKEFLEQILRIDWVKAAEVSKKPDNKTIEISSDNNSLSLRLYDEENKVKLEISDGRYNEFIAKKENDKLNIYDNKNKKIFDICQLLKNNVPHYDWVGFYLVHPLRKRELVLGPFIGEPTRHVRIPFGRGVCGKAAEIREIYTVDDVLKEPSYLSCSAMVKSETVVPILKDEEFLFSWDEIPGNGERELKKSIEKNVGFGWVKEANIVKKPDNETIEVSSGNNSLLLRLHDKQAILTAEAIMMKMYNCRIYEFNVKKENDKQKIYNVEVVGELDIDSYNLATFREKDKKMLKDVCEIVSRLF